jgi:hypothetical protein
MSRTIRLLSLVSSLAALAGCTNATGPESKVARSHAAFTSAADSVAAGATERGGNLMGSGH